MAKKTLQLGRKARLPASPAGPRHCWVIDAPECPGRWPGVLLGWEVRHPFRCRPTYDALDHLRSGKARYRVVLDGRPLGLQGGAPLAMATRLRRNGRGVEFAGRDESDAPGRRAGTTSIEAPGEHRGLSAAGKREVCARAVPRYALSL